ncbi:MAG: Fur family transcriptional regulator [Bacteroidales bacterium]|nr:Fur family transcriptional regulator [Bacteroidales bacterium]MDT8431469.1 Fur family transcriptional regulator [Bacteroidales bacterium]
MSETDFHSLLKDAGLKVTPQRVAVLEAVFSIEGHPSSDEVSKYVKKRHPNIALGTIYNILDSLTDKGILNRVKTDKGVMLYDSVGKKHHHLYCNESNRIEDFYDDELDAMLEAYFTKKKISGFDIRDIKLQLVGKFKT